MLQGILVQTVCCNAVQCSPSGQTPSHRKTPNILHTVRNMVQQQPAWLHCQRHGTTAACTCLTSLSQHVSCWPMPVAESKAADELTCAVDRHAAMRSYSLNRAGVTEKHTCSSQWLTVNWMLLMVLRVTSGPNSFHTVCTRPPPAVPRVFLQRQPSTQPPRSRSTCQAQADNTRTVPPTNMTQPYDNNCLYSRS